MNFNHHAQTFDRTNLVYLAQLSSLVYRDKAAIQQSLSQWGFNLPEDGFFLSSEDTHTQALIASDNDKVVIAFRGTEGELQDWTTDAKITKVDWPEFAPKSKVHVGFHKALDSIWEPLMTELQRLSQLSPNAQAPTIWITGHSLGGALATLAAARLHQEQPQLPLQGVYSFGQPRIANHAFAKRYNDALQNITYRLVNNNDVVTRVPPQVWGYSHLGTLYYFDADGQLHNGSDLTWWRRFWDRLEGRYDNVFELSFDGVADHSMQNYLQQAKQT